MGFFLLECGFRSLHCDLVVSSITVWKSKVKVFDVQVHEGEDKLHAKATYTTTSVRNRLPSLRSRGQGTRSRCTEANICGLPYP
jgi:hypothetical protein